ncbi:hypothetical protein VP01_295g4 [Puccinia sorghi]|uniref:Major facilitator superfamily (MFS) profile domain-containing protein n=1 Tax=Puccinia sorghi TaxID=27349 RepID=A0A0L6V0W3_9BASI|nr:hypothetical protein VP01_295g4 [Puccinia sorghi]
MKRGKVHADLLGDRGLQGQLNRSISKKGYEALKPVHLAHIQVSAKLVKEPVQIIGMSVKTEVDSNSDGRKRIVNDTIAEPKYQKRLVDLNYEYETGSGRVIVDPVEAEVEVTQHLLNIHLPTLGKTLASQLKLDKTGQVVLWPQPSDDRHDPQNWSKNRKLTNLIISTMAAFIPDFNSGIGVACLFPLAREYRTTPGEVNNVSSNWSIFLLGPGGLIAVMLAKRYGRLPILFWSQVFGLAFLIGCTFAPNLSTFAAMRCLNAFFSTAPQVTGLLAVTGARFLSARHVPLSLTSTNGESFSRFIHRKACLLNFWGAGFLVSPYMSPCKALRLSRGKHRERLRIIIPSRFHFERFIDTHFLCKRQNYRWAYAIGSFYSILVVLLIAFFVDETIYDRYVTSASDSPDRVTPTSRLRTLIGITGYKTAHMRCSWKQAVMPTFKLLTKPHCLSLLIYTGVIFGFAIGINVTNGKFYPIVVFASSPPPLGYGLSQVVVASLYATPVVAVLLGEVIGRYLNDKTVSFLTHRNHGIFEPEMRLWTMYTGIPLIVVGFVVLGGAFQHKWNLGAVVLGWGMAEVGIMITTVATLNYLNNSVIHLNSFFPVKYRREQEFWAGLLFHIFKSSGLPGKGHFNHSDVKQRKIPAAKVFTALEIRVSF